MQYNERRYNNLSKITKIAIFYTLIMGLYQVADKLFGASYLLLMNNQGLSIKEIGIILGFQELVLLITDYPSGIVSDYIGRKKTAGIALIIYGLGLYMLTLSKTIVMFLIAFFLIALGSALFSGSPQSWFYDTMINLKMLKERERLLPKMSGVVSAFSMVSSLLAVILIKQSIVLPLYIGAIVSILCGIFFLLLFEDNKGRLESNNFAISVFVLTKKFFSDGRMRTIVLMEMLENAGYSIFILLWQLYLMNQFNLKEYYVSAIFVLLMIAIMIGNFVAEVLLRVGTLFQVTNIGKGIMVFSFLGLYFVKDLWMVIGCLILFDLGLTIANVAESAWQNDYISSDNRASYISAISSLNSVFGIIITVAIGFFVEKYGYHFTWILAGGIEILSIVVFAYFLTKYKDMKEVDEIE